ncbi:hypothetical protein RclHR1_02830013 [Rhizophagus clarus]|nr:hypothetical protein RclHR1_02830013 [Rhizophagus clarus]
MDIDKVAKRPLGIITNGGLSEFWRSVCVKVGSVIPNYVDGASFFTEKEKIEATSLRVLRDQRGQTSVVHSIVLVGTEVIKDFLLAVAQKSKDSTSIISPFSAERVFNSVRFTSLEVSELLAQYAKENRYEIDVDGIAADVYSLTLGRKGLIGA